MFIDIPLGFIVLVVQKLCICMFLYILYSVILYQWATIYISLHGLYTADHYSLNGNIRSCDTACIRGHVINNGIFHLPRTPWQTAKVKKRRNPKLQHSYSRNIFIPTFPSVSTLGFPGLQDLQVLSSRFGLALGYLPWSVPPVVERALA